MPLLPALLLCLFSAAVTAQAPRPNVVLIVVDDLGWRDLGCQGSGYFLTPQIDHLAASGMRFTNAYANAPNCAPSRACLMSGQYTPRHGVYTVGSSERGRSENRRLVPTPNTEDLREDVVTLAEALRGCGYATVHLGKWHLGADPTTQGFDRNVAGNRAGSPPGGHFSPYRNPQLADGPKGEYLTDRLTDEAIAFLLERPKDRPFFLQLCHYAVHTPIQSKQELRAKFRDRPGPEPRNPSYAAMVESVDQGVGRLLGALDELRLRDDTVVVLFSDNGGHGPVTSMAPLRGAKGMLYEGGIRVPLLVSWPGHVPAGRVQDTPVIGTDLFPTLLALAGGEPPAGQVLDGVDLGALWRGEPAGADLQGRSLFWHMPVYLEATAATRAEGPWRTTPAGAMRRGRWKLLEFFEDGRLELYDLGADEGEQHDLSSSQPEVVAQLHGELVRWRTQVGAPVPTQANPGHRPRLTFPPRDAQGESGAALVARLATLPLVEREAELWQQFERGNVPTFLGALVPVTRRAEIAGREHTATFWVSPDYFGFGSDDDWCRMPMTPPLAQAIADRLGCVLPTRGMVDAIWGAATQRLPPTPFSPREFDIVALPLFLEHHRRIQAQLGSAGRDVLIAGIKKDVVVTARLAQAPGRVAIYGWHRPDGSPIQPLYIGHSFAHVDYSHGVRLCARQMVLDGAVTTVAAVLADEELSVLLSDEGPLVGVAYPVRSGSGR